MNPQLQSNLGVPGKGSAKGTAEASAARAGWGHSTGYCPSKFQFPQNPARSMGSAVTSLAHSSQNTLYPSAAVSLGDSSAWLGSEKTSNPIICGDSQLTLTCISKQFSRP